MPFQLYTVNHLTHALTDVAAAADLAQACEDKWQNTDGVHSLVVLSTCNRVEVYASADPGVHLVPARSLSDETLECSPDTTPTAPDTELTWNFIEGRAVAEHLFRVACGLDSMVVGEAEVAGQVRRAFTRACENHQVHGLMVRMFEDALTTARRVASETSLTGLGRSVVSVALDLAQPHLGEWTQTRAVLVGTGSYAGSTVAQLRARGVKGIANVSTSSRVKAFAHTHGTAVIPPNELPQALADADLVVACRGIGAPVLTADQVKQARELSGKDLVILDLALQRDIEAAVSQIPGVTMYSLEDVRHNVPALAVSQIQRANTIISEGLTDYDTAVAARHMDPAIITLRKFFEEAAASEIASLPDGDTIPREAAIKAVRHVVAKLAHTPTVSAHMAAAEGLGANWVDALSTVWGLTPEVLEDAIR